MQGIRYSDAPAFFCPESRLPVKYTAKPYGYIFPLSDKTKLYSV
jgi:hypothetical protein